jgi:hypothetical protein
MESTTWLIDLTMNYAVIIRPCKEYKLQSINLAMLDFAINWFCDDLTRNFIYSYDLCKNQIQTPENLEIAPHSSLVNAYRPVLSLQSDDASSSTSQNTCFPSRSWNCRRLWCPTKSSYPLFSVDVAVAFVMISWRWQFVFLDRSSYVVRLTLTAVHLFRGRTRPAQVNWTVQIRIGHQT